MFDAWIQIMGASCGGGEIRRRRKRVGKRGGKQNMYKGQDQEEVAHGDAWEEYGDEADMADSNESLEELFTTERTPIRFPNVGDDMDDDEIEDASEEAGLAQALATRTPGPKIRRGDVDRLHLGIGNGPGMNDKGVAEDLEYIEGDSVGFAGWSGSSWMGLGADVVAAVEAGRYF